MLNWLPEHPHHVYQRPDSHSTKDMSLPVRPPILLTALLTPYAARLRADPPDEVTLERPSEAFD